jgi:hypothetical protein
LLVAESRTELIQHYALDAFEELVAPKLEGWATLDDNQRLTIFECVEFGAQVACTLLGETGTYEQEYQTVLDKLRQRTGVRVPDIIQE